jgi:hypothetical protein
MVDIEETLQFDDDATASLRNTRIRFNNIGGRDLTDMSGVIKAS